MAIYWVDPFLEATTQGNGTTSTTIKDGSYASPFSWHASDLMQENVSNASDISALDGNTLADGDEIRIKGLPFSTLFQSLGECYFESISYNSATIKPITGNTDYANKGSSDVFCFDTTFSDYFFPTEARSSNKNWYFTTHKGTNSSTQLTAYKSNVASRFFYNCGFTSSSGGSITGGYNYPTVYQLKDTYSNKKSLTNYYNHWGNINNKSIQISSGWISETARGGISILEYDHNGSSYRYMYWFGARNGQSQYGAYTQLWLDCPELYVACGDFTYVHFSANAWVSSNSGTARTASLGGIIGAGYQFNFYLSRTNDGANKTYIINQLQMNRGTVYYGNYGNNGGNAVCKYYLTDTNDHITHWNDRVNEIQLKIGSQLTAVVSTDSGSTGTIKLGRTYVNYLSNFTHIEFLDKSFYTCSYYNSYYTWSGEFLAPYVYGNGLYSQIPTIVPTAPNAVYRATESGSPLANMNYTNFRLYPPTSGGSLGTSSELHSMKSFPINGNRWFDPSIDFPRTHPLVNIPFSVLKCDSSDYRTASVDITATLNSLSTGQYNTFNFDSNDYDNAPVTLLPSEGDAPPSLLYNDTITGTGGNVNCLVMKHPKVSTSVNIWVFPMVINLPDDFDPTNSSKDQIRITYSVAKNTTWTSNTSQVYAFYKDMPNSANGYVGYITASSTDVSNPDTRNVTFSPTLGSNTPKQNSILIGTGVRFPTNTTDDMKLYFTDISVSAV